MSVGTVILECTSCGVSYDKGVLYGDFKYIMPSGEKYPLDRSLGWCNYCLEMVPIEDLSGESIAPEIEKWTTWESQAKADYRNSMLSRLFTSEEKVTTEHKRELSLLRERLNYLEQRNAPPKCLKCGSDDVKQLPFPPSPQEVDDVLPAGWRHPLCGGEMVVKALPTRFHFSYPERLYDQNGVSINFPQI